MEELKIVGVVTPAAFNLNFDEVNKVLDTMLVQLDGRVVTADSLKADKQDLKKLASLRTSIESFRKAKKKEAETPIKAFEEECKALVSKVSKVEAPLSEQIEKYNDLVREEKKSYAEAEIAAAVKKFMLDTKRAEKLIVKPEYLNLTQTKKFVKEDIENIAIVLKEEQEKETKLRNEARTLIETLNESVSQKKDVYDFEQVIDMAVLSGDSNQMVSHIREVFKKLQEAEAEIARKASEKAREEVRKEILYNPPKKDGTPKPELPKSEAVEKPTYSGATWSIAVDYEGPADALKALSQELQEVTRKYGVKYTIDKSRSRKIA